MSKLVGKFIMRLAVSNALARCRQLCQRRATLVCILISCFGVIGILLARHDLSAIVAIIAVMLGVGLTALALSAHKLRRSAAALQQHVCDLQRELTKQRQAETALRTQYVQHQVIFDAVPAWIRYKDTNNRIIWINQTAAQAEGYTVEALEGQSSWDIYPADLAAKYHADDLEVIRSGVPKRGMTELHQLASGENRWLQVDKIPYEDGEGNIIGVIAFALDITERKRAEQALAERIDQVEALRVVTEEITRELDLTALLGLIIQRAVDLVEAATSGAVYLWDETEQVLIPRAWHNRGDWIRDARLALGEGITGRVAQQRQGFVVNDYPTSPYANALFVKHLGLTAVVSEPLLYRDQLIGVIALSNEGTGQPFSVQDSQTLDLFASQAVIAIENARLYEDVRETRDFLQSIAENSVDAIVTTDAAGKISYWTPGAEELLGYRSEEVLALTGTDFYCGGLQEARNILRRLKDEGRIQNYETTLRTRAGRRVEVSSSLSLLRDMQGEIIGTLAIIKDITERKQAERERLKVERQMQQAQKLESLGELAGGIAHDFNNLLTGILNNVGMAQRRLVTDHAVQQYLAEIRQGSKLASHLTGQLLAYAGKGQFDVRPLDLSAEVMQLEPLLKTSAQGKACLFFELAESPPAVEADPVQIHQVLMNLVINAAECIEDEVTVRIKTYPSTLSSEDLRQLVSGSPAVQGRYVALEVADNGCGMDEVTQQRLFDPFFTTKATGSGLGLAATLGIVHGHGGGIRLISTPHEGTTFRIFFPVSDKTVETVREVQMGDLSGHGLILVVDDDAYVRQAAHLVLQGFGYKTLAADGGRQAIEIFRARGHAIDLVVLDMTMPGMNGAETFRALRELCPEVKVLLSTAYDEDEVARQVATQNLVGLLRKPYDPEQLAASVKQILASDEASPGAVDYEQELAALRASYGRKLPGMLEELAASLRTARANRTSRSALRQAHRLAHRLKGTAGSYGFDEIAAALVLIEGTLKTALENETSTSEADWTTIEQAMLTLKAQ